MTSSKPLMYSVSKIQFKKIYEKVLKNEGKDGVRKNVPYTIVDLAQNRKSKKSVQTSDVSVSVQVF